MGKPALHFRLLVRLFWLGGLILSNVLPSVPVHARPTLPSEPPARHPTVPSDRARLNQTTRQQSLSQRAVSPSDTLSRPSGTLLTDSTLAVQLRQQARPAPQQKFQPKQRGRFLYQRTLVPLNHFGGNVYAPLLENPLWLNEVRRLKDVADWHPFRSGHTPAGPYDYHYTEGGITKPSQTASLNLSGRFTPRSIDYFIGTRFTERWGPFPNQHETRLNGLLRLSGRIGERTTMQVQLLLQDNGWLFNRVDKTTTNQWGNSVYTDRARYALEALNAWRAWAFGWFWSLHYKPRPNLAWDLSIEQFQRQWQSRFRDLTYEGIDIFSPSPSTPLVSGIFPARIPSRYFAERNDQTTTLNLNLTSQGSSVHRLRLGSELRFHSFEQRRRWLPSPDLSLDGSIPRPQLPLFMAQPREQALYLEDQVRFGPFLLRLGLRLDRYDPHGTSWLDLYRVLGDRFGLNQATRQEITADPDGARARWWLSPQFRASYPLWGALQAHLAGGITYHRPSLATRYLDQAPALIATYAFRESINLYPQRTRFLEFALQRQGRQYGAQVTGFYRDMDTFTARPGPEVLPQTVPDYPSYWGPINTGFQDTWGMEVQLVRRPTPLPTVPITVAARLAYTVLFDFLDPLWSEDTFAFGRLETPGDLTAFQRHLDLLWDRTHWLAFSLLLQLPGEVAFSLTSRAWSGPRYISPGSSQAVGVPGVLSRGRVRTGPSTFLSDIRLEAPIPLPDRRPETRLLVEVRNLFNRANINTIPHPWAYEGLDQSPAGQPDLQEINRAQEIFGPARAFWLGLEVSW